MQFEGLSERRACSFLSVSRSTKRYRSKRNDQELAAVLQKLSNSEKRFGRRRLQIRLKELGHKVKHKKLRRIYQSKELQVLPTKRRRLTGIRGRSMMTP